MLLGVPAAAAEPDPASEREFFGLLRVRDLTPFGFRRLDMRQSPAAFAPPDGPSIEFDLGYQNTWSLSSNVDKYLRARTQRGPLTQADAAAIRAMGGEDYLVDLELALIDIAFNYRITERIGGFVVLSGASYTGGFLDGFVEGFHSAFGFGSAARPGLDRNQINVLIDLKGQQVTLLDAPANSGVLDPVIGLRYAVARDPSFANLVFETAIKVPLGRQGLYSTNRVDVGTQLTLQAFHRRNAWYASAAAVYFSGSEGLFPSPAMLVPTAVVGYEYRWLENTNLIAQFYASRSTFTAQQTDLAELRGNKFQLSLGVRHRLPHGFWSFAFTENLRNFNNTPDIGFQFGLGQTF